MERERRGGERGDQFTIDGELQLGVSRFRRAMEEEKVKEKTKKINKEKGGEGRK